MSNQDVINMLNYFEHAPIGPRNEARKIAIDAVLHKPIKGRWILLAPLNEKDRKCKCSTCNFIIPFSELGENKFCRNCGSDMRGV